MMALFGKLGLVLALAFTLSWGVIGVDFHADAEHGVALEYASADHGHDADVDSVHLAHHSCHHHLSDRTSTDPAAVAMLQSSSTYLSSSELGRHGIAVGPLTKPPAAA